MSVPYGLLPEAWNWAAGVLYLLIAVAAAVTAPWERLRDSGAQHVYLGACVGVLVLWSMNAGISPGLGFHPLGATTLTLMFGWQLAVIGTGLATLGVTLSGTADWQSFGCNEVLFGALPVLVSHALFRVVDRRLPNHFFVYIFLCAFLGGALAMTSSALATLAVMAATHTYSAARLRYEYLPYLPLMILPEAVLNGMVMTVLVALRPGWVSTFDDERYLRR